jgi:hypothetical protein
LRQRCVAGLSSSDVGHRWINRAREQAAVDVSGGDMFFNFGITIGRFRSRKRTSCAARLDLFANHRAGTARPRRML